MLDFIQAAHCEDDKPKYSHTFALYLHPVSLLVPSLGQSLDIKFWFLTSDMARAFQIWRTLRSVMVSCPISVFCLRWNCPFVGCLIDSVYTDMSTFMCLCVCMSLCVNAFLCMCSTEKQNVGREKLSYEGQRLEMFVLALLFTFQCVGGAVHTLWLHDMLTFKRRKEVFILQS